MRLPALLVLALVAGLIVAAGAALAADAATPPASWGDVEAALIGLALSLVGIAAAVLVALRPVIVAAAARMIEDATTARVKRIDDALEDAVAAGSSPAEAAQIVAAKLPQTLKRSNKDEGRLEEEAVVKAAAREGRMAGI